jgi:glycosyltransferase involved in cell wall biosynthesis
MSTSNLISVIIPVYNCEKYIAEAIESVLSQTYKAYEIIVIDDGSEDNSAAIIKSFPNVQYYRQKNRGLAAALNTGLSKVTGNFISFLDSDDIWVKNKLEKQIQKLNEDKTIEGIFSYHKRFYSTENGQLTESELADTKRILPAFFKAALLIRKESFFKVGLFDESITMGDFLDWYRRAMDLGIKMEILKQVLFFRRIHNANSSLINRANINDYVRIMKTSMDRRRKKDSI